jgi:D-glycero-alpha-D-manno-heptose-7-phosphate kinase
MIITQTPLRVSFAGGGTDLPDYYTQREGYVVSAAIDKFVHVIVSPRYDDRIHVSYSKKETVDHVDQIENELVREAMRITGVTDGVELTLLADIPSEGSGLGSSSSFTVGLLNALHVYRGQQVGPLQLAEEACEIEIVRCGKPIGKQDQYIAAFGGFSAFRFRRDGRVDVRRLYLDDEELYRFSANVFLFFTDQTRKAAEILADQKSRTQENMETLDAIKQLAVEAELALEARQFDRIGKLLAENWQLKTRLSGKISNQRIEEMYTAAMRAGAYGAKLCGAGGGGFLMVYCPAVAHEWLLRTMRAYRQMPFLFERDGSKVIFDYRRPSWKLRRRPIEHEDISIS